MSQQPIFFGMNNMSIFNYYEDQMMYGYGNMQANSQTNIQAPQIPTIEPPKKERLRLKMSIEEKYF